VINLADWPPEEERAIIAEVLSRCETMQQAESALGAMLFMDVLADMLTTPPVWRKRWYQFWRPHRRGGAS